MKSFLFDFIISLLYFSLLFVHVSQHTPGVHFLCLIGSGSFFFLSFLNLHCKYIRLKIYVTIYRKSNWLFFQILKFHKTSLLRLENSTCFYLEFFFRSWEKLISKQGFLEFASFVLFICVRRSSFFHIGVNTSWSVCR